MRRSSIRPLRPPIRWPEGRGRFRGETHDPGLRGSVDRPHPRPGQAGRLRCGARRLALQCRDRACAARRCDGVRLAHFGGRQRRGARQFVGRERRRSEFRRARRAPDHARLRHARHRQDRFALFVLPRCDRLRRPVALSGRVAQRRPPPACRLDRGGRPAPRTIRRPRADGSAPQRNRQLRSQHPTSCDAGSRLGEASRRAASLARTSGQGQPGRPRVALSRPRASRTASPPGRSPARDFA